MSSFRYLKSTYLLAKKSVILSIFFTLLNTLMGLVAITSFAPLISLFISDLKFLENYNGVFKEFFSFLGINYSLESIITLFCLTFIFSVITNIFLNHSILKLKYDVMYKIINNSLKNILDSDISILFKKNFGEINNTFTREIEKISNSFNLITRSISNIFFVICISVFIIIIDFKITLIIFSCFGFFYLILSFFKNYFLNLGFINTNTGNKVMGSLTETLNQFKIIKIYQLEDTRLNELTTNFKTHQGTTLKFQTISLSIPLISQVFALISVLLIFLSMGENISVVNLSVILLALQRMVSPFSQILAGKISLNVFQSAHVQLEQIINEAKRKIEKKDGLEIQEKINKISLDDVSFYYNSKFNVFNNLNFEFKRGKINIIKGKSGKGKSTLIDLILGLLNPTSGTIYINDINLKDVKPYNYRSIISYVPQDAKLLNISIKKNILIGSKNYDEKKFKEVLELSGLKNIDKEFSNSIETIVGESGHEVSGGQRQRILIARGLYKTNNSSVLLLDEPTSSLDIHNQSKIIETIKNIKNNIFLIVATHDKRILDIADNILNIEDNL